MGGAGLQRDVDASIAHLSGGELADGFDLGVGESGGVVVPLGDHLAALHDHGSDSGVGGSSSQGKRCLLEGQTHEPLVGFGNSPRFHPFCFAPLYPIRRGYEDVFR